VKDPLRINAVRPSVPARKGESLSPEGDLQQFSLLKRDSESDMPGNDDDDDADDDDAVDDDDADDDDDEADDVDEDDDVDDGNVRAT
jgi:hypothetical protein